MTVLVTGGAGYIGAHVVADLRAAGEQVVVVDDLSSGDADRVGEVPLERLDLAADGAADALSSVLRRHRVESVVHLAAKKRVDESVRRPVHYWSQNVGGLTALLVAMAAEDVRNLVFSSSAAVYGDVRSPSVREGDPTVPANPYGATKLAGEWLVGAAAGSGALSAVSLRYFNVAGAAEPRLVDRGIANLIPIAVDRMLAGRPAIVHGTDYGTPDGTGVRDYVHVVDLARAHVVALDAVRRGGAAAVYNVGTGTGLSVRRIVAEVARQLGVAPDAEEGPRRPGDPATVVADPDNIRADLGWTARLGVEAMVASTIDGLRAARGLREVPSTA